METILSISKDENISLPKTYHRLHNLCVILYDQLSEIFTEDNYKGLTFTTFNSMNNFEFIDELKDNLIQPIDWLNQNKSNIEIDTIITKRIIWSVIADFSNFIFESLSCAKRGKMIVAYALLRKPITDELLIFEQLLGDNHNFINNILNSDNPECYDPSNKKLNKKEIIQKSIENMKLNLFPSSEYIYDLRYNKSFSEGINGITNHALHIVTMDKSYRTPKQNLNFVFSDESDYDRYYNHYYYLVSYLLIYSVSVIDELIFGLLKDSDNQNLKIVKEFRRLIGLLLLTEYASVSINQKKANKILFQEIAKDLIFICPNCKKENKIQKADCVLFFETEIFNCKECYQNLLSTNESIIILQNAMINIK